MLKLIIKPIIAFCWGAKDAPIVDGADATAGSFCVDIVDTKAFALSNRLFCHEALASNVEIARLGWRYLLLGAAEGLGGCADNAHKFV